MKQLFILLLSLLLALGVYGLEGGSLASLLVGSAVIPLLVGPFISTLFSYRFDEIGDAFKDAFAQRIDLDRLPLYRLDVEIFRSLESALLFWAFTIVILAVIGILSSLTEVSQLGPQCAMAMISLLFGFGLRAILITPMKNSIIRKIVLSGSPTGKEDPLQYQKPSFN